MRGITDRIHEHGAELVLVGSGKPHHAAAFRDELGLDTPLLVDPTRKAYDAANLERGVGTTFNLKAMQSTVRAFKGGHRQTRMAGDPWQQGGTLVIDGDRLLFAHVSKRSGDNADPEAVLQALAGRAA